MSPIKPSHLILSMIAAIALSGCGDKNDKAVFSPDTGHSAGWNTAHKSSAKADLESCVECHGEALEGGKANVSCNLCHIGGTTAVHPSQWGNYAYARHKSFVTTSTTGTGTCANTSCHGPDLLGVAGSGPSCATACHIGGALKKHPADWTQTSSHKNYVVNVKANDSSSCKNAVCHGTTGKGVFLSGPACDQCHSMK